MRILSMNVFFRILSERGIPLHSYEVRQRTNMVWKDDAGEYVIEWREGKVYPCVYTKREISS